jgi:hypothetical protein
VGREKGAAVPYAKPLRAELPVFVTVAVIAGLVVLVVTLPNASVAGLTLAVNVCAMPLPLSITGEPVTGKAALTVSVPLSGPAAFGLNTTPIVQVLPAASAVPQVPPAAPVAREKGPVNPGLIPVRLAVPVLLSVTA